MGERVTQTDRQRNGLTRIRNRERQTDRQRQRMCKLVFIGVCDFLSAYSVCECVRARAFMKDRQGERQ